MTDRLDQSKAMARDARLSIQEWLTDPDAQYTQQINGKPSEIGVCVTLLAEKLDMAQPTVSRHLELLRRAGFITFDKQGRWSFFRRDERAIADYKAWINEHL